MNQALNGNIEEKQKGHFFAINLLYGRQSSMLSEISGVMLKLVFICHILTCLIMYCEMLNYQIISNIVCLKFLNHFSNTAFMFAFESTCSFIKS